MKFTVQRKELSQNVSRVLTGGQLSLDNKSMNNVKVAFLSVKDNVLTINGLDFNTIIFVRLTMPCISDEDGEFSIPGLEFFYNNISAFKGETITVETTNKSYKLSDHKMNLGDNLSKDKVSSELRTFIECHGYRNGDVGQRSDKIGNTKFTKWFTVPDGKVFKDLESISLKNIKTNKWNISTKESKIVFSCENSKLEKNFSYQYEGEVHDAAELDIEWLHPILSNLLGETEVWYYITTKGNIQLWFHTPTIDWYMRYDIKKK